MACSSASVSSSACRTWAAKPDRPDPPNWLMLQRWATLYALPTYVGTPSTVRPTFHLQPSPYQPADVVYVLRHLIGDRSRTSERVVLPTHAQPCPFPRKVQIHLTLFHPELAVPGALPLANDEYRSLSSSTQVHCDSRGTNSLLAARTHKPASESTSSRCQIFVLGEALVLVGLQAFGILRRSRQPPGGFDLPFVGVLSALLKLGEVVARRPVLQSEGPKIPATSYRRG